VQQSIDISWPPSPQQQTRRSSDGTDGRTDKQTDARQFHRRSKVAVTPYFPSTAKNLALQEIISGHHYLNHNLFNFTINLEVALLLRQFLID